MTSGGKRMQKGLLVSSKALRSTPGLKAENRYSEVRFCESRFCEAVSSLELGEGNFLSLRLIINVLDNVLQAGNPLK